MVQKVLSINYSDSSCQSGIQNDLKIFHKNNVFGFSAITQLTTPTKENKLYVENIKPTVLNEQLSSVFSDGGMDATKIGSIPSKEELAVILPLIHHYKLNNIVLDISFVAMPIVLKKEIISQLFPLLSILIITPKDLISLTDLLEENATTNERLSKLSRYKIETIIIDYPMSNNSYGIFLNGILSTTTKSIENLSANLTSKLAKNEALDFLTNE